MQNWWKKRANSEEYSKCTKSCLINLQTRTRNWKHGLKRKRKKRKRNKVGIIIARIQFSKMDLLIHSIDTRYQRDRVNKLMVLCITYQLACFKVYYSSRSRVCQGSTMRYLEIEVCMILLNDTCLNNTLYRERRDRSCNLLLSNKTLQTLLLLDLWTLSNYLRVIKSFQSGQLRQYVPNHNFSLQKL